MGWAASLSMAFLTAAMVVTGRFSDDFWAIFFAATFKKGQTSPPLDYQAFRKSVLPKFFRAVNAEKSLKMVGAGMAFPTATKVPHSLF